MIWIYIIPYYSLKGSVRNEEEIRMRIQDYYTTSVLEEIYGVQFYEFAFPPHGFASIRKQLMYGFSNPDDIRTVFMSSINRGHRAREHYLPREGHMRSMVKS